jgi:Na+-transporting methylmalonyl-CoA/oxaloacetate decarboxylase gamma subunit
MLSTYGVGFVMFLIAFLLFIVVFAVAQIASETKSLALDVIAPATR